MSQENVEIVRRYLNDLALAHDRLTELIATYWEPDGDYYPVRKFPEARPCHGRKEIEGFVRDYLPAWERYEYETVDVRTIGDDRVLARGRIFATGRESGLALEGDLYHSMWLRHGHFIRVEDHLTERGALHALGVTGEPAPEAAGLSE
jgi:hypothetical protein